MGERGPAPAPARGSLCPVRFATRTAPLFPGVGSASAALAGLVPVGDLWLCLSARFFSRVESVGF